MTSMRPSLWFWTASWMVVVTCPVARCFHVHHHHTTRNTLHSNPLESNVVRLQAKKDTMTNDTMLLPWTDHQAFVLKEKVPKFTVQVPAIWTTSHDNITRYVLWHNLVADTPELAGYPAQFLVDRLQDLWTTSSSDDDTLISSSNDDRPDNLDQRILPVLDEFKFESQGGLVGSCYGMEGIADGTRIQTTPVFNVQATVHQGYLRTEDGSVLYELGQPLVAEEER